MEELKELCEEFGVAYEVRPDGALAIGTQEHLESKTRVQFRKEIAALFPDDPCFEEAWVWGCED